MNKEDTFPSRDEVFAHTGMNRRGNRSQALAELTMFSPSNTRLLHCDKTGAKHSNLQFLTIILSVFGDEMHLSAYKATRVYLGALFLIENRCQSKNDGR